MGKVKAEKAPKVVYREKRVTWKQDIKRNWGIYLIFIPALVFFLIFCYAPMFGILMAFQNYKIADGIFGSEWVLFDNFITLFTNSQFWLALRNTVCIALLRITISFIMPIIFAVFLSECHFKKYKRVVQTLSYTPNFIAAVVVAMLVVEFFGSNGVISAIFGANWVTGDESNSPVFWFIYTFMGIWQGIGWGSIMYVATISSVNGDLYEAAAMDGASRMQRLFKITLPSIKSIIIMMFVMQVGLCFGQGYESIILLYNPTTNLEFADTIYSLTYRIGLTTAGSNYGLATASGLFQSIVCTILLVTTNQISKKMNEGSALF